MLYRKIESTIRQILKVPGNKVPIVSGARQIGKSYIIRYVGKSLFKRYVELNLIGNKEMRQAFSSVSNIEDFYLTLSAFTGELTGSKKETLVFIDEIQECPNLLTLLKFLNADGRFTYIASGSLLGVSLHRAESVPIGSIEIIPMYPLDFEEFLIANNFGRAAIERLKECFNHLQSPDPALHQRAMNLFRRYLLVGGMPDAVNEFLSSHNLAAIRRIQNDIHTLYAADASKYDIEHRLKISKIYDLIPSNMENKKKRVIYKDIENKTGKRSSDYEEEMEYLISSGVALEVTAVSNPKFPLIETERKNLLKLYLNDVGLLSAILFHNNPAPILEDRKSINLGSLYECAIATELTAHGFRLYYYDNRNHGEVDFLIDDFDSLSVVPLEVKSGKDYRIHSALSRFVSIPDYYIKRGYVLSNSEVVEIKDNIVYIPIYFAMFFNSTGADRQDILI